MHWWCRIIRLILKQFQVLEKDCNGLRKEKEKLQSDMVSLQITLGSTRDQLTEANLLCESLEEARVKMEKEFKR